MNYQLDDTFSLTPTPGHSPHHCCVNIRSRGQHAVVTGDMMHHALQCREPDWSTIFDTDTEQAAQSRRSFLGQVADTGTLMLPIHFPARPWGRARRTAIGSAIRSCDRRRTMRTYRYDHVHLRSPDPDATGQFFETMFGAEVTRSVYPPGTLYPGQMRVTMRVGGQKVLIAPTHPHDPTGGCAAIPVPWPGAHRPDGR